MNLQRGEFWIRPKLSKSRLAAHVNLIRVLEDLRAEGKVLVEVFWPVLRGSNRLMLYKWEERTINFAAMDDWISCGLSFEQAERALESQR